MPDESTATTTASALPASTPGQAPAASGAPAAFDWKTSGLDDGGLALVTERGWKGPGDVLQSYRNLEKLTGVPPERMVKLPGPKDDPKAWDEVYTKLGRPETADKYVIPVPEGDKGEFAGVAKDWFHKAGVTQSQATKLAEHWNGYMSEQQKAQQTQVEQRNATDIVQLKQAWGTDYDAKASLADRAAETFGMTETHLAALKQTMGPKAAMEFLHNIGSKVAVEDKAVPGMDGKSGAGFAMTPEMAQAKIAELKRDKTQAQLFNSPDPRQRQEARAEMDRLVKIAYPGSTPVGAASGRAGH